FQLLCGATVGEYFDEAYLDDAVLDYVEAGGFEVKKYDVVV
ncbi:MAG: hypothetical protein ACI94D_000412, partial [Neolewinella sp.]